VTVSEPNAQEPVIRDKRRIDPTTGAVRPESAVAGPPPPAARAAGAGNDTVAAELAERTADLQRLQAEYVNYRRRVERDREAVRELAVIAVLNELLPVLDDIGRARAHGELVGGFKVVAEALENGLGKLGLTPYGEPGEAFDPKVHEALLHGFSDEVSEPTCVEVLQPGYRVGERILRPARVRVAEPDLTTPVEAEEN
jgi:molecular chaperone GrpE